MINTSYYELETPVPLENLQYIKVGQTVKLISTDLNKTWSGKVSRIGTQIDPNTQNIPLYIRVSGTDLKDGMYLKGELEGASLKDVVKLPKNIFLNPKTVYLVKDSTLFAKEIIPIKRADDFVIVKGIELGEMIVTGSLAGLFQGQKVTY
jgi:multidrug efflux pump subunit AcrA (membrane-fusion protein)